jgi:hypothetical protein
MRISERNLDLDSTGQWTRTGAGLRLGGRFVTKIPLVSSPTGTGAGSSPSSPGSPSSPSSPANLYGKTGITGAVGAPLGVREITYWYWCW